MSLLLWKQTCGLAAFIAFCLIVSGAAPVGLLLALFVVLFGFGIWRRQPAVSRPPDKVADSAGESASEAYP